LEISPFHIQLTQTIFRVRSILRLGTPQFCDYLQISEEEAQDLGKAVAHLSLFQLDHFCTQIGTSVDHLLSGKIDFSALKNHQKGPDYLMPERYANGDHQFSIARSISGVQVYLSSFYGSSYFNRLMNRLQLSEHLFSNPQEKISSLISTDLLRELEQDSFSEEQIFKMGLNTFITNRNTELGKIFGECSEPSTTYQKCAESLSAKFELLNHYRIISLSHFSCVIEASQSTEVLEAFKTRKFGIRYTCVFRQGVLASFPGFIGFPFGQIKERKCVFHGDASCIYEISWQDKKELISL